MPNKLETLHTQEDKNAEILRNSELGLILEQVYWEAVQLDPRLGEVEIVPLDKKDPGVARAVAAWSSESGKHQLKLRVDDLSAALTRCAEIIDRVPNVRELFAAKLGISPDNITPQMLYVFGLAHELGHMTEFMDHEDNHEQFSRRLKEEKAALPIGNATVTAIMIPGTRAHQFVFDNWESISKKLKVNSWEELYDIQHTAYRDMTSERVADDFAEKVFIGQPTIVDQMMAPSIEPYRTRVAA